MSCKDCFNGCAETVSDRCIKYTGVNVPQLDIESGDSVSKVNGAIIENLLKTMNGTGVLLDLDPKEFCEYIQPFFDTCETITLVHYIQVLMLVVCDLKSQIDTNAENISTNAENITTNTENIGDLTPNT